MPSDSVGRVIGNTLLQIVLLPFNFIIWLVTSPELITLLCILSEILIELVVSAVMAGVSIIVSAVILMEDDPEPSLIMTPPSYPKKSFLHGGDSTCITYSEKEDKPKDVKKNGDQVETIEDEDRKSVDKTDQRTSLSSRSLLDRWLPKYGTPREDTRQTPVIEIPVPPVEGSEPESNVTEGSGETFRSTDEDTGTRSTEFDDLPQIITELVDAQLGGDGGSLKTDSERAGSLKTDNDRASSPKGSLKNDSDKVGSVKSDSERTGTGSMKTDSENASSANLKTDKDSAKIDSVTSGSEAGQYRSSVNSKK